MSDSQKCPNPACGATSPASAAFCSKCGARLQSRCPNPQCGAVLHGGEKFCSKCGTPLTGAPIVRSDGKQTPEAMNPTNELERDVLDNAVSGLKKGIDNKLLADNVYTVPVDGYLKPNEELGVKVVFSQGENQERALFVYSSLAMFHRLPFSKQVEHFGGEYYKKTGQILTVQWSLKEILKKSEDIKITGLNVNTGCGEFEFYLSIKDATALAA
jgi:hypothetical protein